MRTLTTVVAVAVVVGAVAVVCEGVRWPGGRVGAAVGSRGGAAVGTRVATAVGGGGGAQSRLYRPRGQPHHHYPSSKFKRHYSIPPRAFPPPSNRYYGPPRKVRNPVVKYQSKPGAVSSKPYYSKYLPSGGHKQRAVANSYSVPASVVKHHQQQQQQQAAQQQHKQAVPGQHKQVVPGQGAAVKAKEQQQGQQQGGGAPYSSLPDSYQDSGSAKTVLVPSTMYGVPHPTSGSPDPPKSDDQPTSYVSFFQGTSTVVGGKGGEEEENGGGEGSSYSYKQIHYPSSSSEKKQRQQQQRQRAQQSHHQQQQQQEEGSKTGSFQAPKETFGFIPYDSSGSKGPLSHYYESSLSPNYYDPAESTKRARS